MSVLRRLLHALNDLAIEQLPELLAVGLVLLKFSLIGLDLPGLDDKWLISLFLLFNTFLLVLRLLPLPATLLPLLLPLLLNLLPLFMVGQILPHLVIVQKTAWV